MDEESSGFPFLTERSDLISNEEVHPVDPAFYSDNCSPPPAFVPLQKLPPSQPLSPFPALLPPADTPREEGTAQLINTSTVDEPDVREWDGTEEETPRPPLPHTVEEEYTVKSTLAIVQGGFSMQTTVDCDTPRFPTYTDLSYHTHYPVVKGAANRSSAVADPKTTRDIDMESSKDVAAAVSMTARSDQSDYEEEWERANARAGLYF